MKFKSTHLHSFMPDSLNFDPAEETLLLSDDKLFYTIEGEGEYIGQPSVFMRLSMCNLTCKGFASADSPNGCDSYVSWSIKNKYTFQQIWDEFFEGRNFKERLTEHAILKYTGGEPLVQQKQLMKFTRFLCSKLGFIPRLDFETNATIIPDEDWVECFHATFTTSPKLSSNGDSREKSYKPDVLKWHVAHKSGFKFVVSQVEDIEEIWYDYVDNDLGISVPRSRIWFMPCCGSRKEHIEKAESVVEYAKAVGVNFSPRLHLLVWDKALKV